MTLYYGYTCLGQQCSTSSTGTEDIKRLSADQPLERVNNITFRVFFSESICHVFLGLEHGPVRTP